ncbi:replication factor C small subunit [Halalkalicoccus paucihalophilus]|uniref:Replication factor C small subunit n=1 Tax=Halalkalicoccus paucihalophilus TaxID=1008153 RepID=A0A151AC79_9EURY|nr:AAA family ATPase [Halalkalicoccus paucihalophilus]KYH25150.1 replication factor C small subunit [Halalkalicoccus paucihalophilus]
MDAPLWTETHAPTLAELPQEGVREYLTRASEEPINLVLYGPKGAGKTAAVRALAREAHDSENDLVEINVADFFGMTKKELSEDPRFSSFITPKRRRETSKAGLINHVLKESASYPPVSGDYKTILLDNAEAIREDFQQALRRVMERNHEAAQFVITTRQPSALIAPIVSRCFPVPVRAPTTAETVEVLEGIVVEEGVEYDREGLEYVASYADGDLRTAVLGAQTVAENGEGITMETAYEALGDVGVDDRIEDMLVNAENGAFIDARKLLDELLIDEGYDGGEVLEDLLATSRSRYNGEDLVALYRRAGEIDMDLTEGTSDRIQLGQLLADLGAD